MFPKEKPKSKQVEADLCGIDEMLDSTKKIRRTGMMFSSSSTTIREPVRVPGLDKYMTLTTWHGCFPVFAGRSKRSKKFRIDVRKAAADANARSVVVVGESGLEKDSVATFVHELGDKQKAHHLYRISGSSSSFTEVFGTEEYPGVLDSVAETRHALCFSNFVRLLKSEQEAKDFMQLLETKKYYSRFHGEERVCHARLIGTTDQEDERFKSKEVLQIAVPSLRARSADIDMIASAKLTRIVRRRGQFPTTFSPEAMHRLKTYSWSGNLRELGSVLERAVYLFENDRAEHPYIPWMIAAEHTITSTSQYNTEFLRYNLLSKFRFLQSLTRSPWVFDNLIKYVVPPTFALVLAVLWLGPQTREENAALTIFWTWWWPGALLSYPLLSRVWCAVCPFMACGELVQAAKKALGGKLGDWPSSAKTNGPPFAYGLFAAILMWEELWNLPDNGSLSAWLLVLITTGAVVGSLNFEKRIWCRYYCPIGAMNGLYSKMALLEIRSWKGVCSGCTAQTCIQGSPVDSGLPGEGCPLDSSPKKLADNADCVMCFRCVKSCEKGSPEFNLRPPGIDFGIPFLLPIPGTEVPAKYKTNPWQAALLFLLQGAVYVHFIPLILQDIGLGDTLIASSQFGDGLDFYLHSVITLVLLLFPAGLLWAADELGKKLDASQVVQRLFPAQVQDVMLTDALRRNDVDAFAMAAGGTATLGRPPPPRPSVQETLMAAAKAEEDEDDGGKGGPFNELVHVAYGYLPMVWTCNIAFWISRALEEGGTILPRTVSTLSLDPAMKDWLPYVVADQHVVEFVQGGFILFGLPFTYFLTQKICKDFNLGPAQRSMHALLQLFFAASLWHCMIH